MRISGWLHSPSCATSSLGDADQNEKRQRGPASGKRGLGGHDLYVFLRARRSQAGSANGFCHRDQGSLSNRPLRDRALGQALQRLLASAIPRLLRHSYQEQSSHITTLTAGSPLLNQANRDPPTAASASRWRQHPSSSVCLPLFINLLQTLSYPHPGLFNSLFHWENSRPSSPTLGAFTCISPPSSIVSNRSIQEHASPPNPIRSTPSSSILWHAAPSRLRLIPKCFPLSDILEVCTLQTLHLAIAVHHHSGPPLWPKLIHDVGICHMS